MIGAVENHLLILLYPSGHLVQTEQKGHQKNRTVYLIEQYHRQAAGGRAVKELDKQKATKKIKRQMHSDTYNPPNLVCVRITVIRVGHDTLVVSSRL